MKIQIVFVGKDPYDLKIEQLVACEKGENLEHFETSLMVYKKRFMEGLYPSLRIITLNVDGSNAAVVESNEYVAHEEKKKLIINAEKVEA